MPPIPLKSVLVTGGLGFVGSRIVHALREKYPECHITIVDIPPKDSIRVKFRNVVYISADVTIPEQINSAMQDVGPQAVIHTAGLIPSGGERYLRRMVEEVVRVNVGGTRNVLAAAQTAGCRAVVYTSSCCAVTDCVSDEYANIDERWPTVTAGQGLIYGESKAQAEALVLAANNQAAMSTCVLRPCVVFGEKDTQLIPAIHACIAQAQTPFVVGDGMNLWDTVYVDNVADAHILAIENLLSDQSTAAGEVFFIQNNEPISFREFSLEVWKNVGHVPAFEVRIPRDMAWLMGLLAEWVTWVMGTQTAALSRGSVWDACAVRYAGGEKARRLLGFVPRVGLEEGIRRSCQAYAKRLPQSGGSQANRGIDLKTGEGS